MSAFRFVRCFAAARKSKRRTDSVSIPLPPRALGAPIDPLRVLLVGACALDVMCHAGTDLGHTVRHMLLGSGRHSSGSKRPAGKFDAVIAHLSLRGVLVEATGRSLSAADVAFSKLDSDEEAAALLSACGSEVRARLATILAEYREDVVLVMTFFEPSFNYLGDVSDCTSVRHPRTFVRRLNELLASTLSEHRNAYVLDVNDMLSWVGRGHLQDDVTVASTHESFINDWDLKRDVDRIVPPTPRHATYRYGAATDDFGRVFWYQVQNTLKTICGTDSVKLIIVDLDDTLWRGVAAEDDNGDSRTEGWPTGFVEALLFYKQRGGLLALCSKNDEAPTIERIEQIWRGAIGLDDFVVAKINWRSKPDNIAEILAETNLQADNCLFIDDNPRELAAVKVCYPAMRCVGGSPYEWRRIVLRCPETQVARISDESRRRTGLVHAAALRTEVPSNVSQADWLRSLNIQQRLLMVRDERSKYYARTLELLNKTNQFNTTGKRWTEAEFREFLTGEGQCVVTLVTDRTADNGLVGVALVAAGRIVQVVLSCRVFNLGCETCLGRVATLLALKSAPVAVAAPLDTGRNLACHGYFQAMGYRADRDTFKADRPCPLPEHITVANRQDANFPDVDV